MPRTCLKTALLLGGLALSLLAACRPAPETLVLEGRTMGTGFQVRLARPVPDPDALHQAIEAELAAIDRQMSTWRDDSEIARFNRARDSGWHPISPAFATVLRRARELSETTGGALDVTLRPLARAWGFQGEGPPRVPPPDLIDDLRAHAGMAMLELAPSGDALRKLDPALELDVSALAKGYAVDRLAARVAAAGGQDFLVAIGGEVRAAGERPGGGPWRIGVERVSGPERTGRGEEAAVDSMPALLLRDEAVASSGDYRNYFLVDGERYAHVLDPATGRPAAFGVAVATVVAPDAITADALATAFMAMPPDRSLALADELGVALRLALRGADGPTVRINDAFRARQAP